MGLDAEIIKLLARINACIEVSLVVTEAKESDEDKGSAGARPR
jgi:hypothetical protein